MQRILNKAIENQAVIYVHARCVSLYINVAAEEAYIDTDAGFDIANPEHREALLHKQELANMMGFEVIEHEPPTDLETGGQRNWLEQAYFVDEQAYKLTSVGRIHADRVVEEEDEDYYDDNDNYDDNNDDEDATG